MSTQTSSSRRKKNLFCSVVYEAISRSVSCFLVGILPWVQCTVSVEKLNGEFSHAWLYEAQEKPRSTTLASWRLVRLPASCTSSKKWAQHFSEDVAIVTKELRRKLGTFVEVSELFFGTKMEVATQLDQKLEFCSLKICDSQKKPRNVQSDLFTILLLIYHMVQWMKVNKTIGQSEIDDLE